MKKKGYKIIHTFPAQNSRDFVNEKKNEVYTNWIIDMINKLPTNEQRQECFDRAIKEVSTW